MDIKAIIVAFINAYVSTHTTRNIEFFNSSLGDIEFVIDGKFRVKFGFCPSNFVCLYVHSGYMSTFGHYFVASEEILDVCLDPDAKSRRKMNKVNKQWLIPHPTTLFISRIIDTVIS